MQELAILATRVMTMQRQFTATADNIANVNTQGYRKLELEFKEIVSRPSSRSASSYTEDRAIRISADQGSFIATGNQLDAAISGDGFFAINVDGQTHYTRKGQFLINPEGTLVTPEGFPVLDNAGAQIQFPPAVRSIKIAEDGTIGTEQGQLAQIGVFTFSAADMGKLQRTGNTAFAPVLGAAALPAEFPRLRQGYLEGANVNAITEMANMQDAAKAYESSMKLLRGMEELESRALRTLGSQ